MKGRQIKYTAEELAWIEARKSDPREPTHTEFCAKFGRSDVSLTNLNALCKRKGWFTGRTGRFFPGQTPANKGKPHPSHPNTAKTQFKKGQLPHNTRHLGHERISQDGYVEITVAETNPHTGFERRYVLKHRHLWEQANGPLPADMCLKCLDGNKTNTDPGNWEAIPRALLPRLNGRFGRGFESAAPEVKPTIMLIAKLEHQLRSIRDKTNG